MTSTVTPFKPRRSYLDECRHQGISQRGEEALAEKAELEAIAANLERRNTADVHALSDLGSDAAHHADAVNAAIAGFRNRCEAILEAYEASGAGLSSMGFLRHIMFETSLTPNAAAGAFSAIAQQEQGNRHDQ